MLPRVCQIADIPYVCHLVVPHPTVAPLAIPFAQVQVLPSVSLLRRTSSVAGRRLPCRLHLLHPVGGALRPVFCPCARPSITAHFQYCRSCAHSGRISCPVSLSNSLCSARVVSEAIDSLHLQPRQHLPGCPILSRPPTSLCPVWLGFVQSHTRGLCYPSRDASSRRGAGPILSFGSLSFSTPRV